MKGSTFKAIASKNTRYRIKANPLHIVYPTIYKSCVGSTLLFEQQSASSIITTELTKDFRIGGHADYDYLLSSVTFQRGFEQYRESDIPICIVYIDLRNFSKRALFVDNPGLETIDEIATLKQKAISTWITIARYYQAHIHSITGDGLMILLGGKQEYDADNWTIGARAFLLSLRVLESEKLLNEELKQYLIGKKLEQYAVADNLLDIKVSVDFSPKTLMNPQGVFVNVGGYTKPVGEVKATSFQIDSCAKSLSFYTAKKSELDGTPKGGRVLIFGQEYKDLMDFTLDKVAVKNAGVYSRRMFNYDANYSSYYTDVKDFKENILTLDDVASLCNVYDNSLQTKAASINIARSASVQHG